MTTPRANTHTLLQVLLLLLLPALASSFSLFGLFSSSSSSTSVAFLEMQRAETAFEQQRGALRPAPVVFPEPADHTHTCVNRFLPPTTTTTTSPSSSPSSSRVLFASRVGDGVCDCCDGSDEANVGPLAAGAATAILLAPQCPDVCEQEAESFLAQRKSRLAAYNRGKSVRDAALSAWQEQQQFSAAGPAATTTTTVDELTRRKEHLEQVQQQRRDNVEALIAPHRAEAQPRIEGLLGLAHLDTSAQADLVAALLDAYGVAEPRDVSLPTDWMCASSEAAAEEGGGGGEDEETDVYEAAPDVVDVDASPDSGTDSPQHFFDPRVRFAFSACGDPTPETTGRLVLHLLETTTTTGATPSQIVQMVMAYYRLHGSFSSDENPRAAADFGTATAIDECPGLFAHAEAAPDAADANCGLAELLQIALDPVLSAIQESEASGRLELAAGEEALRALERELDSLNEAQREREQREAARSKFEPDFGEFYQLSQPDEQPCLEKKDGQYTYRVCLGRSTEQIAPDEGGSTSLGDFERIEHDEATGGVVMHFGGGAYCHAFGARTSTVHIECGGGGGGNAELLSASEPSTCAYRFVVAAPHACTPAFAELHGLL